MAKTLDQARYKCALGGIQTAQAIEGVLPILHAGPGCADKLATGYGTSGHFAPRIFPCSNLSETEIVFGGEKRLQELIENAVRVIDADLYIVLTGCSAEIIGDDAEEVVNQFRARGKPVIHASTAGFKGSNYLGYEWILEAIISQYLEKTQPKTETGLVNVFASLPQHDPYWHGNYDALENLLQEIGLKANILFGYGRGVSSIEKIPHAQFNLVVNPWLGVDTAQILQDRFGTPYLHYPNLPIGAFETSRFLSAVGEFAELPTAPVQAVIEEQERRYYYFIERFADLFLENRVMSKRFTVASDAQYALAITKFLVNDMGLFPQKQFAMENVPEKYQADIESSFNDLRYGVTADVSFETDGYLVHEEIKQSDYLGYPLLIGSAWEKKTARETKAHFLPISWPLNERLVMHSSYVGYDGGLKLLEDIYSVVLTRFN
ncbi:MAG: hydrogenase [Clostridiales bacterium]|jgi:nitrogenase molybdenum-iron protein beta chain|nr:hydrogenase [Clostridiales bacterium]